MGLSIYFNITDLRMQLRLLYIHPSISRTHGGFHKRSKSERSHMVVVLGSGGHTAEMMSLLRDIDPMRYSHRTYIVSSGDSFSADKAFEIEKVIQGRHRAGKPKQAGEDDPATGTWDLKTVPRARKIHQPLYTTPLSSLWCLFECFRALRPSSISPKAALREYPDVIVTNGPATAVMVILAATILKFLGLSPLWKMKTVYVESWARVKTLSLSGKILLWSGICDTFLVQWEALARTINGNGLRKKVEWVGFLVE